MLLNKDELIALLSERNRERARLEQLVAQIEDNSAREAFELLLRLYHG